MTGAAEPQQFEFDIAVSFAGEDRDFVANVVTALEPSGLKVFYDDRFKAEAWGEDLVDYFTDIYQSKSRFAVIFVSRHYAEKNWTNLERRSVLARALTQRSAYVLPVQLDDTRLDGLLPTVAYLDARVEGVAGIVTAINTKVGTAVVTDGVAPTAWLTGVPSNQRETELLLLSQPPAWEYLAYFGLLRQGKRRLEDKYLDFEMGYAPHSATLSAQTAYEYLGGIPSRFSELATTFGAVLNARSQELAFGLPGHPGDFERITHLAQRLLDVYETFLDICSELRGTAMPDVFGQPRDALVDAVRPSIEGFRAFIEENAAEIGGFPARLSAGENIHVQKVFTLEIDSGAMARFVKGMKRARKSL